MRRRIVLPFDAGRFRETSVTDRPGDWGRTFDDALAEANASGDLINLQLEPGADNSYLQANETILQEALTLAAASGEEAAAVLVWNGMSRAEGDITGALETAARVHGLQVFEISTL